MFIATKKIEESLINMTIGYSNISTHFIDKETYHITTEYLSLGYRKAKTNLEL